MKGGSVFGFGVEDVDLKDRLRKHHEGELRHVFYARPRDRNLPNSPEGSHRPNEPCSEVGLDRGSSVLP